MGPPRTETRQSAPPAARRPTQPATRAGSGDQISAAEVDGHPITAAHCQELLAQLQSHRTYLALYNPDGILVSVATPSQLAAAATGPGLGPPAATDTYRPTRSQDRHVRTRDRTCRHFGCPRKATRCDLDHPHTWPAGKTGIGNLCCYRRTHHRLRHQAPGWTHAFTPRRHPDHHHPHPYYPNHPTTRP